MKYLSRMAGNRSASSVQVAELLMAALLANFRKPETFKYRNYFC